MLGSRTGPADAHRPRGRSGFAIVSRQVCPIALHIAPAFGVKSLARRRRHGPYIGIHRHECEDDSSSLNARESR